MGWTDRIALYIVAAFVVVVVLTGLLTAFWKSAFNYVFRRVGHTIYEAVAGSTREAELKAQTATALRQALTELSAQVASGMRGDKQLGQIRTLCPATRKSCDALLAAYDDGVSRQRNDFYPMLDAIRDAAADCLHS